MLPFVNNAENIFCCAIVSAPNVSAELWMNERRFIGCSFLVCYFFLPHPPPPSPFGEGAVLPTYDQLFVLPHQVLILYSALIECLLLGRRIDNRNYKCATLRPAQGRLHKSLIVAISLATSLKLSPLMKLRKIN